VNKTFFTSHSGLYTHRPTWYQANNREFHVIYQQHQIEVRDKTWRNVFAKH